MHAITLADSNRDDGYNSYGSYGGYGDYGSPGACARLRRRPAR
jgi:hypothetical protein